jgi:hypothetical protein
MNSIEDLIRIAGRKAVILVEKEESVEMARVSINGEWVMQGNYWDFHTHSAQGVTMELGEKAFEWRGSSGLVAAMRLVLPKNTEVFIVRRPYSYATGGGHIDPVTEEELALAEHHPSVA